MSDVPVPDFIKKFVLENSKMDSMNIVSSICGESYMADVGMLQSELEHQDDFIQSDCSMSSGDTTLQIMHPLSSDYHASHDYPVNPSAYTQDVNNNNQSGYHFGDYQALCPYTYNTHAHSMSFCKTEPYSPIHHSPSCDYPQVRAESYSDDINDHYDSDGSVEFSADIISPSNIYSNMTVNHGSRDSQLPHFDEFLKSNHRHNKGNRGRPVTYRRPGSNFVDSDGSDLEEDVKYTPLKYSSPKVRRGAKNILLWKFLLEELVSKNATHVQWVNRKEGTFKFVDTAECSKLWGQKKKKDDMNFEKLSRGIRHYYRDGLMSRLDGTRLVYKFNWDRVPKSFRKMARGS